MKKEYLNEDTEMYAAMRRESQERRASNREKSLAILRERGIEYKTFTQDHYRVGEFDYWPSTGKFYNQRTKQKGRGVFNLLRVLKDYDN